MRIAVTTPDRNIGHIVASNLIESGADVVLLVRNPERALKLAYRGAEVYLGMLGDVSFVKEVTQDVDALLWVTPPAVRAHDVREFCKWLARSAQAAIAENEIPHVVNISSIGAGADSGTGIIAGLHDVETMLDEVSRNICHLRAGFFFENILWQLNSIRKDSCICYPVSPWRKVAMAAARDVAQCASHWLLDDTWTGHYYRGVLGPADLSFEEAAGEVSRGIGQGLSIGGSMKTTCATSCAGGAPAKAS